MEPFLIFAAAGVLAVVVLSLIAMGSKSRCSKWKDLPPSPPIVPFLGNLLQMTKNPHKTFTKLSKKYGNLFTFWFGVSKPIIIINDQQTARQAFIHGARGLSGRPQRYCGSIYTKNFQGIVLKDDDKEWQSMRRLGHHALKMLGEERVFSATIIQEECDALVERIRRRIKLGNALDPTRDLELSALNVICALLFGARYAENDPEFLRISKANSWFIEGIQSGNLVDGFPILRYLPYRPLKLLRDFVKVRDEILERKMREHEATFVKGKIRDFTDAVIDSQVDQSEGDNLTRENRLALMADLFLTGTETTATALKWAILFLVSAPEKQEKAYQVLQSFSNKPPKYEDKVSLPYIEALIAEVLRMGSLAPIAVPHKATMDVELCGYQIPKGTVLLMNIYAMHHDPKYWQDPDEFRPERFLHEEGHFVIPNASYLPFSLGKRVCLGQSLVKRELFMIMCHLLKNFKFEKQGTIDLEGNFGATLTPKPYKVKVTERTL